MIPLGAGRECERDTPRREGKLASLAFPSLLRVSLSRSPFPDPLTPKGTPAEFIRSCIVFIFHKCVHAEIIVATFSFIAPEQVASPLGEKGMRKREREGKT